MQRLGGGGYTRKNKRGGGNDPRCGCDMQAGWPKSLTENIPLPSMKGGASCGIPPIPNYYQGGAINMNKSYSKSACPPKQQRGGACGACSGLPLPTPLVGQQGGGQPTVYNSNPVPDACPFPGTGYCNFYARGGANYGEPMYLQAKLRGGKQSGAGCGCSAWKGGRGVTKKNLKNTSLHNIKFTKKEKNALNQATANLIALKKWRKGESIGFSKTASLKAKGLIPRTSRKYKGKKVVSAKYK